MIETTKRYAYKAFGLKLMSEIPLPAIPFTSENEGRIDVTIEIGDVSELWGQIPPSQRKWLVNKDLFMFFLPDVATFCVREGKKIIVSPLEGSSEDQIRLYILGVCMGALLLQRTVFPLHGSALAIDGKAYGFIGNSGAGKSTIAAALLERGCQFLCDDVIPVTLSENDVPFVTPSFPQQKLWQETLEEFGIEKDGYSPVFLRETKFVIPVSGNFYTEPLPLAALFEIVKTESEKIEILPINRLDRLQTLLLNTYRNSLIPDFEMTEWHFKTSTKIAEHIDFFRIRRPTSSFTAHQLASLILVNAQKEAVGNG